MSNMSYNTLECFLSTSHNFVTITSRNTLTVTHRLYTQTRNISLEPGQRTWLYVLVTLDIYDNPVNVTVISSPIRMTFRIKTQSYTTDHVGRGK